MADDDNRCVSECFEVLPDLRDVLRPDGGVLEFLRVPECGVPLLLWSAIGDFPHPREGVAIVLGDEHQLMPPLGSQMPQKV